MKKAPRTEQRRFLPGAFSFNVTGGENEQMKNSAPVSEVTQASRTLGPDALWKSLVGLEEGRILAELNQMNLGTVHESLGIEFCGIGDSYLEAKMPVDHRTMNPLGILHGGVSVVLAESLGSVASLLVLGVPGKRAEEGGGPMPQAGVGLEVSASHLNSVPVAKPGAAPAFVLGRATPVKCGRSFHFWDIVIRDGRDDARLVCKARLTVFCKQER